MMGFFVAIAVMLALFPKYYGKASKIWWRRFKEGWADLPPFVFTPSHKGARKEWRGIETAPKDGEEFLAIVDTGSGVFGPKRRIIYWTDRTVHSKAIAFENCWMCSVTTCSLSKDWIKAWQPLPEPPEEQKK